MLKYFDTKIKLLLLIRSCKAMANISYGNSEKSFLECENYRFKKYLLALTQLIEIFFIFLLLISNHTVFIIQFEINLLL